MAPFIQGHPEPTAQPGPAPLRALSPPPNGPNRASCPHPSSIPYLIWGRMMLRTPHSN